MWAVILRRKLPLSLIFEEDSFMLLENILVEAGEVPERVHYEALVTTEFAEQAIK